MKLLQTSAPPQKKNKNWIKILSQSSLANNKVCILIYLFVDASLQELMYEWNKVKFIKRRKRQPSHFANSSKNADYPSLEVGEVFSWEWGFFLTHRRNRSRPCASPVLSLKSTIIIRFCFSLHCLSKKMEQQITPMFEVLNSPPTGFTANNYKYLILY